MATFDQNCPYSSNNDIPPDQICSIDDETKLILELTCNGVDSVNRRDTLLGYLNHTCTSVGYRMLKDEVTRPLAHVNSLELRLGCIEHFINRSDSHALVINELNHLDQGVELDKLVSNIVSLEQRRGNTLSLAEKRLDIAVSLHRIINRIPSLIDALTNIDHPIINIFRDALDDTEYGQINETLMSVLEFDDSKSNKAKRQRISKIKNGIHDLFDIARNSYNEAINNLEAYVHELQVDDHLPWKLSYSETKGYLLSMPTAKVATNLTLPPKYIRVVKTRTQITCSTRDMMTVNVRANVSYENSMKLANEVLGGLLKNIMGHLGAIHKLVEIVGRLDFLSSLAKLAISSNNTLVKPKFSNSETIIEESRHPILEKILELNDKKIVHNDVCLSNSHSNFCLITGPNMGGKSVYLKQVALIQIMAQIGSYVPAKSAIIKPVNRIVVRVGSNDDGKTSCSSFMSEMRGVSSALVGDRGAALYLIDEIGRGTSVEDGTAYSIALAEELASRRNCFSLFATHFSVMTKLPKLVKGVKVFQFKIDRDENEKHHFSGHNLIPGGVELCHYGIELAETCGLPVEITQQARKYLGI